MGANRHKGEVSATLGGEEYVLRLAANEWCELEDEFDKSTDEILDDFEQMVRGGKLRMKFVRQLFRAALTGRQPDISEPEAGVVMSNLGLTEAATLLGKVIQASMPDGEAGNQPKSPPKAAKAKKA